MVYCRKLHVGTAVRDRYIVCDIFTHYNNDLLYDLVSYTSPKTPEHNQTFD